MDNAERKASILHMLQGGKCAITGQMLSAWSKWDLHHAEIPAGKWQRHRWPLLIDSLINLRLVDHDAHMSKARPRPYGLAEKRLDYLEALLAADPDAADVLNARVEVYNVALVRRLRDRLVAMAEAKEVVA